MDYEINKDDLIKKIKELIRPEMTQISFNTYINPLIIEKIDSSNIVFQCDGILIKEMLEYKYAPLVLNTIQYITNRAYTFSVHSTEEDKRNSNNISNPHETLNSEKSIQKTNLIHSSNNASLDNSN